MKNNRLIFIATISFILSLIYTCSSCNDDDQITVTPPGTGIPDIEVDCPYLANRFDQFHHTLDVYTDLGAAGNHFVYKAAMHTPAPMNEQWTEQVYEGQTCIKCLYQPDSEGWNGWYFQNGILAGIEPQPSENWGDTPNAGVNATGATELSFYARGETGTEVIEFFAGGIGRSQGGIAITEYPGSLTKTSIGFIELTTEWKRYTIPLEGKDLSYILGGFGWVGAGDQAQVFYLDNIQYNVSRLDEPRLIQSFEINFGETDFDKVMVNTSFLYDDALALIAFLVQGDENRAKLLADAMVYLVHNDRFFTWGHIRNAYQAGDLSVPPGWVPNGKQNTVRMPGWFENGQWLEDSFAVSIHTGNTAWLMLALLAYHQVAIGGTSSEYLSVVEELGEWVYEHCYSTIGLGGFTAGYSGWEPNQIKLEYKATEHQIDLYAAFQRLFIVTGDSKWQEYADHAKAFIEAMWDNTEGKFMTGTDGHGTINQSVIPLDVQPWAILSLRNDWQQYTEAMEYAENNIKVNNGYAFSQVDLSSAWMEGTGQMATAYNFMGEKEKAGTIINFIENYQSEDCGVYATDGGDVFTGFDWTYYYRLHTGATAWWVIAKAGINPFWYGQD